MFPDESRAMALGLAPIPPTVAVHNCCGRTWASNEPEIANAHTKRVIPDKHALHLGRVLDEFISSNALLSPQICQRHAGEAYPEFLQPRAARNRLGHRFGEFIEFVIHVF